jgi:hypothetical protein
LLPFLKMPRLPTSNEAFLSFLNSALFISTFT